jgi:hypothetical protein
MVNTLLGGNRLLNYLNDLKDWGRRSGPSAPVTVSTSSLQKPGIHRFIIENLGFWAELNVLGGVALTIGWDCHLFVTAVILTIC